MVGVSNECHVLVDEVKCLALLDTGSMVTTVAKSFLRSHYPSLPVYPLSDLLVVKGPLDDKLPFEGFVELELAIPSSNQDLVVGTFPVLVSPDTAYNRRVPLLLGTNVLQILSTQVPDRLEDSCLPDSVQLALRTLELRGRHLDKSDGVYGLLRSQEDIVLQAHEARIIHVQAQIAVPVPRSVGMVESYSTKDVSSCLTPGLIDLAGDRCLSVELSNTSNLPVKVHKNSVVGQVCQVLLESTQSPGSEGDAFLDLFDLDNLDSAVSVDQVSKLKELLVAQKAVFAQSSLDLGRTTLVEHRIRLSDNTPFKERPRRIPPALYEEVRQHLAEMLEAEVIRHSESPWSSNVVLVRKKDGSLRFCIDYRRLNQRTIKDAYALPRIEETLDILNGSSWFTTLDLKSGYWQMEIAEEDKEKTAFTVGNLGFFEFNRLPFGLTNSPASFQRLMQRVVGDLHLKSCLVYLDDLVIFSKSVDEHLARLTDVLTRLGQAGLKLKPSKCQFMQRRLVYLGHVVSEEGIECNPDGIKVLLSWKIPSSVKELQQFLGLAGYFRRHVKDFARIARPLHALTGSVKGKDGKSRPVPWSWGSDQQAAFDKLKEVLTNPPLLVYPDFSKPFILRVDASYEGLGAVLCQEQDGVVKKRAFGSGLKSSILQTNWSSCACSGR